MYWALGANSKGLTDRVRVQVLLHNLICNSNISKLNEFEVTYPIGDLSSQDEVAGGFEVGAIQSLCLG